MHNPHRSITSPTILPAWMAILAIMLFLSPAARADSLSLARMKLIWPSAAATFPTGRFGTPDPATNHAGHKTGFDAGIDFGYMLSDFIAVGVSGDYARFPMDFGNDTTNRAYDRSSARTTAMQGQVWARAFFPGGYAHWRPYALFAIGVGRPKAKIESPKDPSVARVEFSVNTSVAVTSGIGVLIPVSDVLSFSIEPRYRQLSTKGSGMEELVVYQDGSSETILEDGNGRLHQKSNTTWWELRVGVTLTLK